MRALLVALLAFAHAGDDDTADAKAKAAPLVNEGNQLYEQGEYQAALEKYEAAYETYPSAKILFNIAEAHNELGHANEAAGHYERFLSEAKIEPGSAIAAQVEERMRGLEPKLAYADITGETGADVAIDGRLAGTSPLKRVRLEPGKHEISATKPGYQPFRGEIEATAGNTAAVEVTMNLVTAQPGEAPPPEEAGAIAAVETSRAGDDEGALTSKWWFWTAVAGTALTVSLVVLAAAGSGDDFIPRGELDESSTASWDRN